MDASLPAADTTLAELEAFGLRAAQAVTRLLEIEQQAAELAASWLPQPGSQPASFTEATEAGQALDMVNTVMAEAVPRAKLLAAALERLSRSVRRTKALRRRIDAGWTGTRSDSRPAMLRRQVERRVGDAIRRERDGEAAERLFDDLAARLDDPALEADLLATPVDEIVGRLCRALGLPEPDLDATPAPGHSTEEPPATDTG